MISNPYRGIDTAWTSVVSDLLAYGDRHVSRIGETLELRDCHFRLASTDHTFLINRRRALSATYACAELIWYLARTRDIRGIVAYAPQYKNFAEGNEAHGAYGARWDENVSGPHGQLYFVEKILRSAQGSRQCVVTMWRADDLQHALNLDRKDLPCTVYWQFMVRGNQLHLSCCMRSEDAWLGLPYDVFVNTTIQRLVASELHVVPGQYSHYVGSMHLYEKHFEAAREAVKTPHVFQPGHEWLGYDDVSHAEYAVKLEENLRLSLISTSQGVQATTYWYRIRDVYRDAVACIASHWGVHLPVSSHPLKKGLEHDHSRRRRRDGKVDVVS